MEISNAKLEEEKKNKTLCWKSINFREVTRSLLYIPIPSALILFP